MRIAINLATKPFVELRPLFARLRLTMAALALAAIALGAGLHMLNARARADEEQMDSLKAQTLAALTERQTNEARMRQPQNRSVLDRSQFLNDLFARKSFSWTAVMMDLERVLPGGVQVTSIVPAITAERDVNIRLRVTGQRELAVDLVRNLERSQRFLTPRLVNESSQTKEPNGQTPVVQTGVLGGVEFEILSGYNPLPADYKPVPAPLKEKAQAQMVTVPVQKNQTQPEKVNRGKPAKSSVSKISGHKPADSKPTAGIKPLTPASGQKPSAGIKLSAASQSTKAGKPSASGGAR
jgi:type IV pilus assembly protein PilN